MITSSYYGFYNYWELYHKVTFDGVNKLIIINDGETLIDVQRDIYSAWKEWVLLDVNSKYEQALSTVGGEPTVAGQRLDVTYFLINGWKIKPYPGNYTLTIIGNIFDVDGGSIQVPANINPLIQNNIIINTNSSVIVRQVDGGGTGDLTEINTKLDNQSSQLVSIENRIISIQSVLSSPIQAELVPSQESILLELQLKLNEIWKIHGLDISNPLVVTQTARVAGTISQTIETTGSTVTQQTTVSRDP